MTSPSVTSSSRKLREPLIALRGGNRVGARRAETTRPERAPLGPRSRLEGVNRETTRERPHLLLILRSQVRSLHGSSPGFPLCSGDHGLLSRSRTERAGAGADSVVIALLPSSDWSPEGRPRSGRRSRPSPPIRPSASGEAHVQPAETPHAGPGLLLTPDPGDGVDAGVGYALPWRGDGMRVLVAAASKHGASAASSGRRGSAARRPTTSRCDWAATLARRALPVLAPR